MLPLTTNASRSEHMQQRFATSRAGLCARLDMSTPVGGGSLFVDGERNQLLRFPRNSVVRITGGIASVNTSTNAVANTQPAVDITATTDYVGVTTLVTVPGVPVNYTVAKQNVTAANGQTEDVVTIGVAATANVYYRGMFEVLTEISAADRTWTQISQAAAADVRANANQ